MNICLGVILSLVLHVHAGESINAALDSARLVYAERGERTTILIEPGTYQEELTIDVPGLTLKNASKKPSIGLKNGGVECDPNAVRITWYYGHGYQYRSMGNRINYGGSRERRWNASVLITAPDFRAENIIFENSFNLYVSEKEAADSLVDISQSDMPWTEKERPRKIMPVRPKEAGSTEVQKKKYSIYWEKGILQGGVDFIFGAMQMAIDKATIVANINGEKGDKCYISAGRSGSPDQPSRGMLFYRCRIRLANEDELVNPISLPFREGTGVGSQVWLARPWRWWGETVWAYTTWEAGILNSEAWHTGLVKDKEGFNPENPCPNSYEYKSQDGSIGRPKWVSVLRKPILPDGTKLIPKAWMNH